MKKIFVVGANGKMGSIICETLKEEYDITKIDKNDSLSDFELPDLVIDFSTAENSTKTARWCAKNGVRLIVGATGQNEQQKNEILKASKSVPVVFEGNFSSGILKLKQIIKLFKSFNVDSVTIFEKHHKNKTDKPSGTALELAGCIEQILKIKPDILSERGGCEIGTHRIDFYFGDEKLSVEHQAFSRKVFALGVKRTVQFLLKQKTAKLYNFKDI